MEPDFSLLFHQSSKSPKRGNDFSPLDSATWPVEWKTTYYKTYNRLPKINLGHTNPAADFFDLIKRRVSNPTGFAKTQVTLSDLSTLIEYSSGILDKNGRRVRRAQPSAGARYPIEIYPLILTPGSDIGTGLYHYDVQDHRLSVLWDTKFSDEDLDKLFVYPWMKNASVVFLMTAVFRRNHMKYGERGYRLVLLEAGHIAQNILLTATALGFAGTPLSGTYDDQLEKLLDIDGLSESYIYAVALG